MTGASLGVYYLKYVQVHLLWPAISFAMKEAVKVESFWARIGLARVVQGQAHPPMKCRAQTPLQQLQIGDGPDGTQGSGRPTLQPLPYP